MRTTILALVERLAGGVDLPEPIVEFGSFRVPGQEHRGGVVELLRPGRVIGSDVRVGRGVDQAHDLHALGFASGSIGTAFLLDTIEHVRRPWDAMTEIRRVLRPGGIVVMSSHMFFPVHAHPDDYWRFTDSGFASLLEGLEVVTVRTAGLSRLPHTVVGVAGRAPIEPAFAGALRSAVDAWVRSGASSWKEAFLAVCPPVALGPSYDLFMRLLRRRNRPGAGDGAAQRAGAGAAGPTSRAERTPAERDR